MGRDPRWHPLRRGANVVSGWGANKWRVGEGLCADNVRKKYEKKEKESGLLMCFEVFKVGEEEGGRQASDE